MTDTSPQPRSQAGWTTRGDFGGIVWPPDVIQWLTSQLLTGAPFSQVLSQLPTVAGSVAFPIAAPDQAKWTGEGEPIGIVQLNESTDIVAVAKLASLHYISNEAVNDTSYPISEQIAKVLADSCGPVLDAGLLYGQGVKEPVGVVAKATAAGSAPDFRAAAITAWGELVGAGATPANVVVFAHPVPIATEWARVGSTGEPIHEDQPADTALSLGPGITCIPVPTLLPADVLAVDTSNVYFVVRDQLTFEATPYTDSAWTTDSQAMRTKLRAAVAAPVPAKSLRTCTITAGP
jgi:Phage capsid family